MPIRMTLCAMLRDMGMIVTEADDGLQALDELAGAPYDIIFIDWYMPGIDGLELVRRIRSGTTGARSLIVMVTSECEDHHIALALEAGVDEYVTKPFDRLTFEAKLELIGYRPEAG